VQLSGSLHIWTTECLHCAGRAVSTLRGEGGLRGEGRTQSCDTLWGEDVGWRGGRWRGVGRAREREDGIKYSCCEIAEFIEGRARALDPFLPLFDPCTGRRSVFYFECACASHGVRKGQKNAV
jgi:hypothetical protein